MGITGFDLLKNTRSDKIWPAQNKQNQHFLHGYQNRELSLGYTRETMSIKLLTQRLASLYDHIETALSFTQ